MPLKELGYTEEIENYRRENSLDSFGVGRVILEHKDRYIVKCEAKEYEAELLGNLRFTARERSDLPAVGDWVSISEYDDNKALIHAVLTRKSIVRRKAVGKTAHSQIIATNIDFGLIVQSVNRDFSINRLERYLTICNASKIEPIIILSKVDLVDHLQLEELIADIKSRIPDVSIFPLSNNSKYGVEEIKSTLLKGKTYCLLGSSGVGKSTLINTLVGDNLMETGEISQSIDRGKHVTSHRELIVMENGILIDNPGMREVGIVDSIQGLEITFDRIDQLSKDCKFTDCTHTLEKGCAVLIAVQNNEIHEDSYNNYLKMEREKQHFESTIAEKRRKDKDFGKMIKHIKNKRRSDKY